MRVHDLISETPAYPKALAKLVRDVRDSAVAEFGVTGLAGQCEGIAADLFELLQNKGVECEFVDGHYDTPFRWKEGDTSPVSGHCWVETRDFILDPSREQFGSNEIIVPKRSTDASKYLR